MSPTPWPPPPAPHRLDEPAPEAFLASVRPFPAPTGLLAGLFTLRQNEPDPDDPDTGQPVAPWDPTALPVEVRPGLHRWLNQVVGHLNETYGWNPARTIPVCWAHHPHLIVLLAALAAQRQDAFADVRPEPAATWTFLTLPMFYRDLAADELETSCRRAGQHSELHRVAGPCGA